MWQNILYVCVGFTGCLEMFVLSLKSLFVTALYFVTQYEIQEQEEQETLANSERNMLHWKDLLIMNSFTEYRDFEIAFGIFLVPEKETKQLYLNRTDVSTFVKHNAKYK